jgi:hypothetical protein
LLSEGFLVLKELAQKDLAWSAPWGGKSFEQSNNFSLEKLKAFPSKQENPSVYLTSFGHLSSI